MHVILKNAISTMNYLLLLQATKRESFPECVVNELSMYIDGLNDLLQRDEPECKELKKEIREVVKEELMEGTYFERSSAEEVASDVCAFYEENYADKYPSEVWYSEVIYEAYLEREEQLDL